MKIDRLEKVKRLVKEWQGRPGDLDCVACSELEEDCFNTLLEIAKILGLDEVCDDVVSLASTLSGEQ